MPGKPRGPIQDVASSTAHCSDSRAVAANSRLTLNTFRAPLIESAHSRKVDTDLMRMTPLPGAAR
jgi:hypothetical protein